MLILLGYLVVRSFRGYLMTRGSLGHPDQPAELVIIAGAGIGSFIVGNNGKAIKGTLKDAAVAVSSLQIHQSKCIRILCRLLLYRLMAKSRQMGEFPLERDIENPRESEIFAKARRILADSVMLDFMVDYLRLIISGHMNTFEIEALMDEEIETHESQGRSPGEQSGAGRGLTSGVCIVAAVMGCVHALGSAYWAGLPSWRLSHMRWWGILPRYFIGLRFISPLASVLC
ncbi:motility-associated protein [Shigella flexneri]